MRHYRLGQGKWVFIDWMGIEPGYGTAWGGAMSEGFCVPRGVALRVHKPRVDPEPVIRPEHSWETVGISPYATFLADGGRFRCWYECEGGGVSGIGYAESSDGVHWTKIPLGQQEIGGVDSNLLDLWGHGHGIFIDPTAPSTERYKFIRCYWGDSVRSIVGATSPDGLRWDRIPDEEPVLIDNNADTQNIGLYDDDLGKYVIYTRQRDGAMQRRGINRAVSADFRHFPPSEPVFEAFRLLYEYNCRNIYFHPQLVEYAARAENMLTIIFDFEQRELASRRQSRWGVPGDKDSPPVRELHRFIAKMYAPRDLPSLSQIVIDHLSLMTDRYARTFFQDIFLPKPVG